MEIRTYLGIIGRYWWIIVAVVMAATVSTAVLDSVKTPVYNAHARVLMRPSGAVTDTRELIDWVSAMGGRYIPNNLAQMFTSKEVRDASLQAMNVSSGAASDYTVSAALVPDTSIIEVTGSGPDPNFVANYVNATVSATISQTRSLYRVIELASVDAARVPRQPSSPQPARDIPTGAALGLGVGILLVLFLDYLRGPVVRSATARRTELTRPVEPVDTAAFVAQDGQVAATESGWLPAPRSRGAPFAGRRRG